MPRIRLLQSVAAVDDSWACGEEADVDAATAKSWVAAGMAELVQVSTEKAATQSRGGGRGRRGGETRTT